MGTLTFAQGRGQFFGSVRKPRRWRLWAMPGVLVCVAIFSNPAAADGLRNGIRAFAAHDYVTAARIFTDLAPLGDARAQTYLGYMFANGKGVPQNYMVAAGWYRCASQQGFPAAQYLLGLMYDKGQGVPQDYVIAYALLDLAVAGAGREREHWVRIRDAVASKLSLIERNRAQQLAFEAPPAGTCLPIVTGY
ncbi:MAG: tetratricopeptide repeat protein [Methylocella sp.]